MTSEKPNSGPMWAQDEYHFFGQRSDEHVVLIRNQHPIVLLPIALWTLVSFLIPYLAIRFIQGPSLFMIVAIYAVSIALIIWYFVYGYLNSVSVLTDQRILSVNQKGFFFRQINEAELTRIQDVSSDVKGILETMFGFGDVTIRTASKDSLLVLRRIADPYSAQQAIVRSLKDVKSD